MYVELILNLFRNIILWMGISVITYGSIKAFYRFVLKSLHLSNLSIHNIRKDLGLSIILGLEFIVGADVIETIMHPTYYDAGILAFIVAIRIVLGYFLQEEIEKI